MARAKKQATSRVGGKKGGDSTKKSGARASVSMKTSSSKSSSPGSSPDSPSLPYPPRGSLARPSLPRSRHSHPGDLTSSPFELHEPPAQVLLPFFDDPSIAYPSPLSSESSSTTIHDPHHAFSYSNPPSSIATSPNPQNSRTTSPLLPWSPVQDHEAQLWDPPATLSSPSFYWEDQAPQLFQPHFPTAPVLRRPSMTQTQSLPTSLPSFAAAVHHQYEGAAYGGSTYSFFQPQPSVASPGGYLDGADTYLNHGAVEVDGVGFFPSFPVFQPPVVSLESPNFAGLFQPGFFNSYFDPIEHVPAAHHLTYYDPTLA